MSAVPASALAVVAHPDDCEFGCGGTLARWSARGATLTLVVLTDGSKGSHDTTLGDDELRDRREAEQCAAAAVLGIAHVRFLRAIDGELAATPELRLTLAAAIRELRPETVLTHDPWGTYDLHPDHAVAGRLVVAALYEAREPRAARELAARDLPPWRPRELYLFRAAAPDHVEEVGDTFAQKLQALLCHRSQYATSLGLDPDAPDVDAFAQRLREHHRALSPDGETLCETFRRLVLPH